MKSPLPTFLLFLLCASSLKAQLKEFDISEMQRPDVSIVQANTEFQEDALIIVYSSLDDLSFRSSMGAIDKQNYNTVTGRYELLIKPIKQMLFVGKLGFLELKINTLNPNFKDVFYFKVEEKPPVFLSQTEPGKLTINSIPAGANISLNGIPVATKTPFTGELNPGPTRIQLSKIKYQTFDTIMNVQSSINEVLTINLKPLENLVVKFEEEELVKDASGNSYKTVVIGDQVWMAENLKTERYLNGDLIPNVLGETDWDNLQIGAWCNYENISQNDEFYGKLYNWFAVTDPRNLCPSGWHVPTDAEWTVLTDYLGGLEVSGGKMKSIVLSSWTGWNTDATNSSGFLGLPGGSRYSGDFNSSGGFISFGYGGDWWSSSEYDAASAWYLGLDYLDVRALQNFLNKQNGFSVRCLKD
jgi:uncharacterized protein (TIGR02145 family)